MTTLGHRLCIIERDEARREVVRLRLALAFHGLDPDLVDLRENDEAPSPVKGRAQSVRR